MEFCLHVLQSVLPSVSRSSLPNGPRGFQMYVNTCVCVWGGEAEGQKHSEKSPSELEAKKNQLKIDESGKQVQ